MRNVSSRPARIPQTLPRLIDVVAQCIVALEVMRMNVLIAATKTGRWYGGVGHGTPLTILTKKYAVKNEPKSMISDAMKRYMPSVSGLIREL
jgi:hypothetical protein